MRILGIDYGEARTGIAITDELNITVQGLKTINNNRNDKILLSELDKILAEYDVDTIVVGMPLLLNGDKSKRAETTEKFIHKLKCKYNKIKIVTQDERYTTVQAYKTMNELNISSYKIRKELVDTISATYILESYLNNKMNT